MEQIISSGIIDSYSGKLESNLSVDVVIVGGGLSGIVAAYSLVKTGKKAALLGRKLAPGEGMWSGAMMSNDIVVQEEAIPIIKELGVNCKEGVSGTYIMDPVHTISALIYQVTKAGATVFNRHSVEDVMFHNDAVASVAVNWAPVVRGGIHTDPLTIVVKVVLEGTGRDCEIARAIVRKNDIQLNTPTGGVIDGHSLNVELGEQMTVENTKEIYLGLFASGMVISGVSGSFRMEPIFGGMLMSDEKAAELICKKPGNWKLRIRN